MRTKEEIELKIKDCIDDEPYGYSTSEDAAYDGGLEAGFKQLLNLQGKSPQEIFEFAQADSKAYVSRGDVEDAWQSGYTTALEWGAERFDWVEEYPVWRSDVWGDPPQGWESEGE